jgi:hypothetical protein
VALSESEWASVVAIRWDCAALMVVGCRTMVWLGVWCLVTEFRETMKTVKCRTLRLQKNVEQWIS